MYRQNELEAHHGKPHCSFRLRGGQHPDLGDPMMGGFPFTESVLGLIVLAAGMYWFAGITELMLSHESVPEKNSNEKVRTIFLSMLQGAKKELLMYDDGDTDAESLYQDHQVVDAIKQRLREQSAFKVRCMLNNRQGRTRFEQELGGLDQVKILSRRGTPRRLHYRVFDRKNAYVSCHQPDSDVRMGQVIKGQPLPWRRTPIALQEYIRDFERHV